MVVTDKIMGERLGLESFRTTEKWQIVGRASDCGPPLIILPGRQVKSWVACGTAPKSQKILVLR